MTWSPSSRPAQEGVQWRDLDIFDVDGLTRAIQRRFTVGY
jgi:hypothetical protein